MSNPLTQLYNGVFGGGPTQYDPVASQLANLSWAQWQQASNAMYGAANQLIGFAENPNYANQQRAQAQTSVDQSFAAQQQNQQQQLGLMGVNPTGAQTAAMARTNALGKAEAEAGAMNQAALGAMRNQQAAVTGGV